MKLLKLLESEIHWKFPGGWISRVYTLIGSNMWTYMLYVCPKSVIPSFFFLLCKVPFFWALCLQTYLFFEGCQGFALYAMWSLKVGKVEKIKNEGLIFTSGGLRKSSKKNHHELLISHDFQAWSNLSIFCIIVFEDLVKTHLRLTEKKTTSPLKLSSKRWIQAWTQAWPLPPVKWLLRSQQWEKIIPNILCNVFFRFRGPLIRGIPEKIGQIESLVGFWVTRFFPPERKWQKGEKGEISRKSQGMMQIECIVKP